MPDSQPAVACTGDLTAGFTKPDFNRALVNDSEPSGVISERSKYSIHSQHVLVVSSRRSYD